MAEQAATSVENDVAAISLRPDGVLVYGYKSDVVVTLHDAQDLVARASELVGTPRPTLAIISGVRSVERAARVYFATSAANRQVTSQIAFVTSSTISRVIANFFLGLNKPACPTRLFTDEAKALAWLAEFQ